MLDDQGLPIDGLSAHVRETLGAWSYHPSAALAEGRLSRRAGGDPPSLVYTVNDPARARALFAAGASGFFTDDPAALGGPTED